MSFAAKRLFSSSASPITLTLKPSPSKAHHHRPLPANAFPSGFLLGGLHVGVKKQAGLPDLAIILSTSSTPTAAAASFTRNTFRAAPVLVSEEVLQKSGGWARGLVVNSGCANAVTGRKGLEDAWKMVEETDALLSPLSSTGNSNTTGKSKETLVMSTGVIGQLLPIDAILSGIRSQSSASPTRVLGDDFSSWENAAKAFMTTDTFPKLRARTFVLGGREYRMAGMTKGAGMIHPNMVPAKTEFGPLHATLLGCIMTDVAITPRGLQSALTYAVDRSFNSISVDGDMSTNDSICVLANGAAAPPGLVVEEGTQEYEIFKEELTNFAADLAKLVVRDGEGATKFVTVTVKSAPTYEDAHSIASRISTSALVKTALYGEDANWGRILAATGSVPSSDKIDPTKVSVTFVPSDGTSALPVLVNGEPIPVDEARAKEILGLEDFELQVELGVGEAEAKYWTCDFSYEYVRINGDYRS
ncbi:hypothetical protein M413DRAFT_444916 [Hebeloma cylindrosporum]|uniref:Arginine biosynthesis bifunctional protein ArgJ, mitochondrial n=1 Tax=Hebeloma cylindrosporum TaxID=76867 RepID=A0A0C2YKX6_HEBCY|nr:hypothetical protein M413DRAFT_444916 [Hebeloma cylindrosporum h7]